MSSDPVTDWPRSADGVRRTRRALVAGARAGASAWYGQNDRGPMNLRLLKECLAFKVASRSWKSRKSRKL